MDTYDYLKELLDEINIQHGYLYPIPTWKLYKLHIINLKCDRLVLRLFDIVCIHESKIKNVYRNRSLKLRTINSYLSYYSSNCNFIESSKSSILNNKYLPMPKLDKDGKSYLEIMLL